MHWSWFALAVLMLAISCWGIIKSPTGQANRYNLIGAAASLFCLGFIIVWLVTA